MDAEAVLVFGSAGRTAVGAWDGHERRVFGRPWNETLDGRSTHEAEARVSRWDVYCFQQTFLARTCYYFFFLPPLLLLLFLPITYHRRLGG